MTKIAVITVARALCTNPRLTAWEASRLCVLTDKVFQRLAPRNPHRETLRELLSAIADYARISPESRRTAMLDVASVIYPCP